MADRQNFRGWAIAVLGCAALLTALGAFKFKQISDAIRAVESFPEPVENVVLAVARTARWQPTLTVTGELIAIEDVEISNELPGRVVELGVEPGQRVASGDLIVGLDTREETAELMAARAEAKLARLALDRNRRLARTGAASAEALDQASALYRSTQARVDGLRAIIDKKTLRAPYTGAIGLFQLAIGQYLDAGTIITRLIGTERGVWVDFNLPQHRAALAIGDRVTIDAGGIIEQPTSAAVIARDAWIDTASRNVRYRALPEANGELLYPGALVSVTASTGESTQAVAVPITAVRRDPYGTFVFVLQPAASDATLDRAARRPVTLGTELDREAIVVAGLVPGERIAGDGSFKLREGALVSAAPAPNDSGGAP